MRTGFLFCFVITTVVAQREGGSYVRDPYRYDVAPEHGYRGRGPSCEQYCNLIYDPVCASGKVTYRNLCFLRCDKQSFECWGRCPCPKYLPDPGSCNCPEIYDPVCTTDNETFDNGCQAECEGRIVACEGPCPCRG
ncbi:serine protease inhibitor dipetalogastin-like [Mya arenaria]|uniref:serine protease inhibitor dipetalogastin-like n=1 Tax=Mya arenaria TaxID=6604 RepID=UPI0022E60E93|nr:serine protease inhibitor dipetalogastin-like [Mya arenaria]